MDAGVEEAALEGGFTLRGLIHETESPCSYRRPALHLPIRGMRIITDPFVDLFTHVLNRYLFPSVYKASKFVLSRVLDMVSYFTGSLVSSAVSSHSRDVTSWIVRHTYNSASTLLTCHMLDLERSGWRLWHHSGCNQCPEKRPFQFSETINVNALNTFFKSDSSLARLLEPHLHYIHRSRSQAKILPLAAASSRPAS